MPPLATQLKSVSCFVEELIKTNTSADFVSCSKISPRTTNTSSPNAAINHFDLFLNNNLFRNDNYNDNIKKSSKTPSKFQYDPLYSEVKEGKRKKYYTSKYERKPALRNSAIEIHGYICNACDINLEDIYGNLAKGFIEVHHIKPLYSLEEEITVDPKRDLVPLCPNCHRMIHRKRDKIMSVSELKEVINSNDK